MFPLRPSFRIPGFCQPDACDIRVSHDEEREAAVHWLKCDENPAKCVFPGSTRQLPECGV